MTDVAMMEGALVTIVSIMLVVILFWSLAPIFIETESLYALSDPDDHENIIREAAIDADFRLNRLHLVIFVLGPITYAVEICIAFWIGLYTSILAHPLLAAPATILALIGAYRIGERILNLAISAAIHADNPGLKETGDSK